MFVFVVVLLLVLSLCAYFDDGDRGIPIGCIDTLYGSVVDPSTLRVHRSWILARKCEGRIIFARFEIFLVDFWIPLRIDRSGFEDATLLACRCLATSGFGVEGVECVSLGSLSVVRSNSKISSRLNSVGSLWDARPRDSGYMEKELSDVEGEAGFCPRARRALCQAASSLASQFGIVAVSIGSLSFDEGSSKR